MDKRREIKIGWDDKIIVAIIEGNIPWRIIGKRRRLTKTLEAHLNGIIGIIENCKCAYPELKDDHIDVLKNNIENLKSQYWDLNKYEEKLREYETD